MLRRSPSNNSEANVYSRSRSNTGEFHRTRSGNWETVTPSKSQSKFMSSFSKTKQRLKEPAPPIFGLFSPTTVSRIPFELERRVERARFELSKELQEERKRILDDLDQKLKIGSELCLQENRERIIQKSQLLSENRNIFNRARCYILHAAKRKFGVSSGSSEGEEGDLNVFEKFDAADELLSQEKINEINRIVDMFLSKYKEDLDASIEVDAQEMRRESLRVASERALQIASHWEALTNEDEEALHEMHMQEVKLHAFGVTANKLDFSDTINRCNPGATLYHMGHSFPLSPFSISKESVGEKRHVLNERIFGPDKIFARAQRDKDALMKRVRQYVRAIESARVTSADIYYHERHSTKTDQHINNSCSTSSGNKMLDKFSRLYTEKRERPEPYNYDEGSETREVYNALQRLRELSLRVELTRQRHEFALERIRDEFKDDKCKLHESEWKLPRTSSLLREGLNRSDEISRSHRTDNHPSVDDVSSDYMGHGEEDA